MQYPSALPHFSSLVYFVPWNILNKPWHARFLCNSTPGSAHTLGCRSHRDGTEVSDGMSTWQHRLQTEQNTQGNAGAHFFCSIVLFARTLCKYQTLIWLYGSILAGLSLSLFLCVHWGGPLHFKQFLYDRVQPQVQLHITLSGNKTKPKQKKQGFNFLYV